MKVLTPLMTRAIEEGAFSGASVVVGVGGQKIYEGSWGTTSFHSPTAPVTSQTLFDLASLTKPVATATLFMMLHETEQIALEDPLPRFFPRTRIPSAKQAITLETLLSHRSGLPAYRPYFQSLARIPPRRRRETLLDWILAEPLQHQPGKARLYSDLGYILLGWILEEVSGTPLEHLFVEKIAGPLKSTLAFRPLSPPKIGPLPSESPVPSIAATERCPWRGRILQGEVHDENTHCLGGVAGHAGLFGTADDVWRWLQALWFSARGDWAGGFSSPSMSVTAGPLEAENQRDISARPLSSQGRSPAKRRVRSDRVAPPKAALRISAETVRLFWKRRLDAQGDPWSLGFDHPSGDTPSAGRYFPPNSVGHLGFTGTSFWLDPATGTAIILLTNRVHPSRNDERIRTFRPLFHDHVMRELKGLNPCRRRF